MVSSPNYHKLKTFLYHARANGDLERWETGSSELSVGGGI